MTDTSNVTPLPPRRGPKPKSHSGPGAPTGMTAAANSNDQHELLKAMRDRIAYEIDRGVSPRDLAPLTRRLMEIVSELQHYEQAENDQVRRAARVRDVAWDPSAI